MTKVILIAIGIAIVGFIPLMGLPGAMVMYASKPTTRMLFGPMAWEAWSHKLGDRAWPLAIMLSLIWPVFVPLAYYVRSRLWPASDFFSPKPFAAFVATLLVGIVVLSQIAVVMAGPVKRLSREEIVVTAVDVGDVDTLKANFRSDDLGRFKVDPLRDAIFGSHVEMATFLITSRQGVGEYTPSGDQESVQFATPLHTAVNVGAVELVRLLLEKGADPNKADALGRTPIQAVSWDPEGDGECFRLLKKHGADFATTDSKGNTPLIALTQLRNTWDQMPDYARILVEGGVDPGHKNTEGRTALDYAKENWHEATVKYLEGLAR